MIDLVGRSESEIVQFLGKRFKAYRLQLNKTQKDIANHIGVSVLTISNFERGKNTELSLKIFLKLLSAINQLQDFQHVLPEIPISPMAAIKLKGKTRQRSSKTKKL